MSPFASSCRPVCLYQNTYCSASFQNLHVHHHSIRLVRFQVNIKFEAAVSIISQYIIPLLYRSLANSVNPLRSAELKLQQRTPYNDRKLSPTEVNSQYRVTQIPNYLERLVLISILAVIHWVIVRREDDLPCIESLSIHMAYNSQNPTILRISHPKFSNHQPVFLNHALSQLVSLTNSRHFP